MQYALKDLIGGTIKEMVEAEMDDHHGYEMSERVDRNEARYYRNGTKKHVNSLITLLWYNDNKHSCYDRLLKC